MTELEDERPDHSVCRHPALHCLATYAGVATLANWMNSWRLCSDQPKTCQPLMSQEQNQSPHWYIPVKGLLVLLALLALMVLCNHLDDHPNVGVEALFDGSLAPWSNALPAMLFMLALLGVTRKLATSFWLSTLGLALLYSVNALKMAALANPLTRQDFMLVGQISGDSSLFIRYLPWDQGLVFVLLSILLVTLALAAWEPPLLRPRNRARLSLAGISLALLLSLAGGMTAWQTVYAGAELDFRPWESAATSSKRVGMISNLMLSGIYAPSEAAMVADPAPGQKLFAAYHQAVADLMQKSRPQELPDIVVLQSESYFDPAIMNGYHSADWVPNLRRLQKMGQHGDMRVPTFGGGTIRTEFEILTGLPLQFFPQLNYPYLGLKESHIPGLARSLESAGYHTLAIHPNQGGFWDRRSVFRRMGFDRFIDKASPEFRHARRHGYYISDHDLTNVILDTLKPSGPPQFIFAISIENHGPYRNSPIDESRTAERDAIPVPTGVDAVGARILRDYLLHQRDADRELGRLADALAKRDRPALLVFYGDHLPGLEEAFARGFKNGKLAPEQSVPYLLISPGHPQATASRDLPAWILGSEILDHAGIHDDAWFALQQVLHPQLRASNWQPGQQGVQQLASLANLRLRNKMPKVETDTTTQ